MNSGQHVIKQLRQLGSMADNEDRPRQTLDAVRGIEMTMLRLIEQVSTIKTLSLVFSPSCELHYGAHLVVCDFPYTYSGNKWTRRGLRTRTNGNAGRSPLSGVLNSTKSTPGCDSMRAPCGRYAEISTLTSALNAKALQGIITYNPSPERPRRQRLRSGTSLPSIGEHHFGGSGRIYTTTNP